MDGHWVRTREATRGALSADDAGRVKSEIALSKHANGPGSRPITPQDCVSENDSGDGEMVGGAKGGAAESAGLVVGEEGLDLGDGAFGGASLYENKVRRVRKRWVWSFPYVAADLLEILRGHGAPGGRKQPPNRWLNAGFRFRSQHPHPASPSRIKSLFRATNPPPAGTGAESAPHASYGPSPASTTGHSNR